MIEEGGGEGREVQCSLVSFDSESSVEFSSLFSCDWEGVVKGCGHNKYMYLFLSSFVISLDSTCFDNSLECFICSGLKCSHLRGRRKERGKRDGNAQ